MTDRKPRNERKVLSRSSGGWIKCVWFECDKPGYELYKSVLHEHDKGLACEDPRSNHVNYVFCSERHRQMFRYSHIKMGYMPPGMRGMVG